MKRYILLRNNRIIDTTKYKIEPERSFGYYSYFYKKDNYELDFMAKATDILKESDNLIDLINLYDWVEVKLTTIEVRGEVSLITQEDNKKVIVTLGTSFEENKILKIWKPNQNGGYDLAWEKEKE